VTWHLCIFALLGKVISFISSSPIHYFLSFVPFVPLYSSLFSPLLLSRSIYLPALPFPVSLKEFREASLNMCCYRSAMEYTTLLQHFYYDLHPLAGQENKYIHCFLYYRSCGCMYMCYQTLNGCRLMIMLWYTESNYVFCKYKQNIHQTGFCLEDTIRSLSNRRTCLSIYIAVIMVSIMR
jgi:hypothetical protein